VNPANRKPVVIKSAIDGISDFNIVGRIVKIKKDGAKPIVYMCIYEKDALDTQGDFASGELLTRTAHNALKNGVKVDLNHDFSTKAGDLVESFILNSADDDRYPGVRKGAWVGAIEPSDEMLPFLDELTGVSLAGSGTYKMAKSDDD